MNTNLFVGGFPYETTSEQLAELFRSCGTVKNVKILMERATGRSRGLGFVEMSTEAEAKSAITKLNDSNFGPRKIFVSAARPQEKGPGGFSAKPGFVERRSGTDRRQARGKPSFSGKREWDKRPPFGERPPAEDGRKEGFYERKKKWLGKSGFTGKKDWKKRPEFNSEPKKPWTDKTPTGGDKFKSSGPKKKWGAGGPGAGKKWTPKRKRFGGGFGGPSGR